MRPTSRPDNRNQSPQPGLALGLATALVALTILGAAPLPGPPGDWSPAGVYRALNRQVQLTYARGVRFASHMRLIYEVRALLDAKDSGAVEAAPAEGRTDGERPLRLRSPAVATPLCRARP